MVYPWLPMELPPDTVPSELRRGAEILPFEQLMYGTAYAFEWPPGTACGDACLEGRLGDLYELAPFLVLDIVTVKITPRWLWGNAVQLRPPGTSWTCRRGTHPSRR